MGKASRKTVGWTDEMIIKLHEDTLKFGNPQNFAHAFEVIVALSNKPTPVKKLPRYKKNKK